MTITGFLCCGSLSFGASITSGESLSGNIASSGQSLAYNFAAVAGDKVQIRMAVTAGNLYPDVELYSPNGAWVAGDWTSGSIQEITANLTSSGTYTVIYKSANAATGSYIASVILFGGNTVEDIDGDGISNVQELRAHTNPFDRSSFFGFSRMEKVLGQGIRLQWQTVGGLRYRVQSSTTLRSADFVDIPRSAAEEIETDVAEGRPHEMEFLDPQTGTENGRRFYRLRLVP